MQPFSPARLSMPPAPPAPSSSASPSVRPNSPATPSTGRALAAAGCGLLLAIAAAVALVRWGLGAPAPLSAGRPEDALWSLMAWSAASLAAWLGLGSVLSVGAALPGTLGIACERLERWLTPRLLRQAVSLALGTAVATLALPAGTANGAGITRTAGHSSAAADPAGSPTEAASASARTAQLPRSTGTAADPAFCPTAPPTAPPAPTAALGAAEQQPGADAPAPGWRPSPPVRMVESEESRLLAPLPRTTGSDATITVLRGDTLWHIAARHLGPGATDAEVALEWPRWHEANRDVIGADADHLVPGQRLRPPARGASR